ncbi:anti-sigma factor [Candidatus Uabimicrobium sp. HlEnr_7]|uniref:anti-sigma factor family protein n=1 Tax=Candidatus Uabimicrobium helgolandensis TaxID=3095367 RepID=UPI00355753AC
MNCQQAEYLWQNYLNGELSKEQQIEIRQHLFSCDCLKNIDFAFWLYELCQKDAIVTKSKSKIYWYAAASLLFACLGFFMLTSSKQPQNSIKIIHIESHTTYISENNHQVVHYYYDLGEYND